MSPTLDIKPKPDASNPRHQHQTRPSKQANNHQDRLRLPPQRQHSLWFVRLKLLPRYPVSIILDQEARAQDLRKGDDYQLDITFLWLYAFDAWPVVHHALPASRVPSVSGVPQILAARPLAQHLDTSRSSPHPPISPAAAAGADTPA